jgi:diguanylate cyclase (GGDEF)-like protein
MQAKRTAAPNAARSGSRAARGYAGPRAAGAATLTEIEREPLVKTLAEQAEEMALQLECMKLVDEGLPPDQAYKQFLDVMHRAVSFDHGTLYVAEWETGRLAPVAVRGARVEMTMRRPQSVAGPGGWMLDTRAGARADAPPADGLIVDGTRGALAFPLIHNGLVAGVVALARRNRSFSEDESARLARLANPLVTTLSRLRREARLRELVFTDAHTGLSNRHHFVARIEEELQRARTQGGEFAVAVLELEDGPGADGVSEPTRTRLAQLFARVLQRSMRASDVAAHLEQRRFGLLLTGVGREQAVAIVDRITRKVLADPELADDRAAIHVRTGLSGGAGGVHSVDALLDGAAAALTAAMVA